MKTENVDLMKMARESLNEKWGLAVGTYLIYMLILGIPPIWSLWGSLPVLLIAGPMMVGLAIFSLSIARNQDARLEQIFLGFNNFVNALAAYFFVMVFVLLWLILLIIPGIIAALSYSLTFFIIADDDSIGPIEAIDKSKKMMYGYKWKGFCLGLRFIGWILVCILTFGIGFLFLIPYMHVTFAKFYDDVKNNPIAKIGS